MHHPPALKAANKLQRSEREQSSSSNWHQLQEKKKKKGDEHLLCRCLSICQGARLVSQIRMLLSSPEQKKKKLKRTHRALTLHYEGGCTNIKPVW